MAKGTVRAATSCRHDAWVAANAPVSTHTAPALASHTCRLARRMHSDRKLARRKPMTEGGSAAQAAPTSRTKSATEACTPGLNHSHCSRSTGSRNSAYTTKLYVGSTLADTVSSACSPPMRPCHSVVTTLLFIASCSQSSDVAARASSSTSTSESASTGSSARKSVHIAVHSETSSRSTSSTTVHSNPAARPITHCCFHCCSGSSDARRWGRREDTSAEATVCRSLYSTRPSRSTAHTSEVYSWFCSSHS